MLEKVYSLSHDLSTLERPKSIPWPLHSEDGNAMFATDGKVFHKAKGAGTDREPSSEKVKRTHDYLP